MSRLTSLFAAVCLAYLGLFGASAQAATPAHNRMVHVLVRLKGSPLAAVPNLERRDAATHYRMRLDVSLPAARAYRASLDSYLRTEVAYLRSRGVTMQVGRRFDLVFGGVDAVVPQVQLAKLRAAPNVDAVLPERTYRLLDDKSLPLINAAQAWQQLGGSANAGRGMYIANIDTGLDLKNPCFGDSGMSPSKFGRRADSQNLSLTNNKVIVARAYGPDVNKQYSASDTVGHGTFTASLEACDYNTPTPIGIHISGVAPAAYLMNYNVFPDQEGTTSDSQILSALSDVLLDGPDVVNMSLGGTAGELRLDAEAIAVSQVVKNGIPVVVAAGNAGPTSQSIQSPASDPDAISVGAVSNSRAIYRSVDIGGSSDVPSALSQIRAQEGSHAFSNAVGPAQMVYVGLGRRPNDDPKNATADDFAGKDLTGKIAVIQRGTIFFETKLNNAAKAGAIGAIVFDNQPSQFALGMDVRNATLPAMGITQANGEQLVQWIQSHPQATASLDPKFNQFDVTPDVLSDFSSRGYGENFAIKPDFVAPGQGIYSATESGTPNNVMYDATGFTSADGTSFAAPHTTGAVALVLQKHPTWTPQMVKSALANTADLSVTLDPQGARTPSVMQDGSGMLNVGAALSASAYVSPSALSFGEVNLAAGAVLQDATLTIHDVSGGAGTWSTSLVPLGTANGLSISVPATATLAAGGSADITVHLSVASSTPSGDYQGYIMVKSGGTTLHVPYFTHVIAQSVKPGSVLLVDATTARVAPDPGVVTPPRLDVSKWYEQSLTALGKTYTYWNEAELGPPSLREMKMASLVAYFTGNNLNGLASRNSEALLPPLSAADTSILNQYLDAGGHVWLSGMGAAFSDPYFTAIEMGGIADSLSMFDNTNNDPTKSGGLSPPKPSIVPDVGTGLLGKSGIFAGMKPIDISTDSHGDGAGDNLAIYNSALSDPTQGLDGMVGVPGLAVINGALDATTSAYGQPALKTAAASLANGSVNVGVVSSDEPSFSHVAKYKGRGVMFSFGFEGINDNTGYATRDQVLQRMFAWFADEPTAVVTSTSFKVGAKSKLTARLHASGAQGIRFIWQVGSTTLNATGRNSFYRFKKRGTYRVRVLIDDSLGHVAVTPWKKVRVS